MAARFPLHSMHQQVVLEQYQHESDARLKFYHEQQALKAGKDLPPVIHHIRDIVPIPWAQRRKREEDAQLQRIREEVALHRSKVPMYPVNPRTRNIIYHGVSKEQEGRHRYLRERLELTPDAKYHFPLLTSWKYGWKIKGLDEYYRRPSFARTAKVEENFYRRNGIPDLTKDQTACESSKSAVD